MKIKYCCLLVLIVLSSCKTFQKIYCTGSQKHDTPEQLGYKLMWEDDFNHNALDNSKWNVREGARRCGYQSKEAVEVKDGCLRLCAFRKNDSVVVGAISTINHFQTTYGYFECRAQMQQSTGIWAAFWLQSPKISQGADPAKFGTEMDIFEYFKQYGKNVTTHALHWAYGPNMKSIGPMMSRVKGLSEGFHTYGFEWTPEKYTFYIDGRKFHEESRGISHINEYIILSMELPVKLKKLEKMHSPDVFLVDYVKVYKKAPALGAKE